MKTRTWFYLRVRDLSAAAKLIAALLAAVLGFPVFAQNAPRWKVAYSYQKLDSILELNDIQCPSPQRCFAAGVISEKSGGNHGVIVLTDDGGKQWSVVDLKEHPISLFFLNDTTGWMVTDRGIWFSDESGRSWKKLEGAKGLSRIAFLDSMHGYAVGFPKIVYETIDGGKKWTKLAAAEKPPTDKDQTSYDCITFAGPHGVIVGNLIQPQTAQEPIWLHPELARFRGEHETKAALLETLDGGKKWNASTLPLVGALTQLRFAKDGSVVLLIQYNNYFSVPSSLYKSKLNQSGIRAIFEERDRAVTDFALLPDGGAVLASIETPGTSNQLPIPGKLKMLKSGDLKIWEEMDVDYRAIAQRAVLAAVDARHIWVATDTGMVLTLVDADNPQH